MKTKIKLLFGVFVILAGSVIATNASANFLKNGFAIRCFQFTGANPTNPSHWSSSFSPPVSSITCDNGEFLCAVCVEETHIDATTGKPKDYILEAVDEDYEGTLHGQPISGTTPVAFEVTVYKKLTSN